MGYCTDEEYLEFMRDVPELERMLVRSGLHLIKFWFSVSRSEQRTRFAIRQLEPGAPMEAVADRHIAALDLWDAYTAAKEGKRCSRRTDSDEAPWTMVKSNDKKTGAGRGYAVGPVGLRLCRQGLRRRGYARSADRACRRRSRLSRPSIRRPDGDRIGFSAARGAKPLRRAALEDYQRAALEIAVPADVPVGLSRRPRPACVWCSSPSPGRRRASSHTSTSRSPSTRSCSRVTRRCDLGTPPTRVPRG